MARSSVCVRLDVCGEDQTAQVKRLCSALLPSWRGVATDDMQLTPITGGISNLLVKVTPADRHGLDPVAVKVFGNKTELLINRDSELEMLLKLNSFGFGAKVHAEISISRDMQIGHGSAVHTGSMHAFIIAWAIMQVVGMFGNGRIEEFLIAKTLTPEELGQPLYVTHIARTLRRLHEVPTDSVPTLWQTIYRWLEMVRQLTFDDPAKQAAFLRVDFEAMKREVRLFQMNIKCRDERIQLTASNMHETSCDKAQTPVSI